MKSWMKFFIMEGLFTAVNIGYIVFRALIMAATVFVLFEFTDISQYTAWMVVAAGLFWFIQPIIIKGAFETVGDLK